MNYWPRNAIDGRYIWCMGKISRQEWSYSQTWRRCMHACLQARYRHDPMTRANHLWPAVPARQDCTDRLLFTSTGNNTKEEKKRLHGQSVSLRSSRVDRDSDREGKTASRSLARRSPSPLAPEIRARACLHSYCSRRPAGRGPGHPMPCSSRRIVLKSGLDRATSWLTARGLFTGLAR
jgi:hypothetical protein